MTQASPAARPLLGLRSLTETSTSIDAEASRIATLVLSGQVSETEGRWMIVDLIRRSSVPREVVAVRWDTRTDHQLRDDIADRLLEVLEGKALTQAGTKAVTPLDLERLATGVSLSAWIRGMGDAIVRREAPRVAARRQRTSPHDWQERPDDQSGDTRPTPSRLLSALAEDTDEIDDDVLDTVVSGQDQDQRRAHIERQLAYHQGMARNARANTLAHVNSETVRRTKHWPEVPHIRDREVRAALRPKIETPEATRSVLASALSDTTSPDPAVEELLGSYTVTQVRDLLATDARLAHVYLVGAVTPRPRLQDRTADLLRARLGNRTGDKRQREALLRALDAWAEFSCDLDRSEYSGTEPREKSATRQRRERSAWEQAATELVACGFTCAGTDPETIASFFAATVSRIEQARIEGD